MKKLRVIQIGTAHDHAADATLTLKELNNDFELLGVVEENTLFLQKAKKNPDYSDIAFISYDDALKLNPDAFLIETEEKLLVPTAKKVLSAGFNVYMDNPTVLKSWTNFANVTSSGEVTSWDYKNIAAGRVALFTSIAYQGFKVSKVFRNEKGEPTVQGGIENIECVPIAGPTQSTAYTPVMAKSWANPKGSKNPEGAAYFLRFFLDVSNTDYENLFHNNQIKEVYNTICDRKAKKQITYEKGVVSFTNKDLYKNIVTELKFATPANIKQKLDSHKKTINAPIKQANNALSRIK